MTVALRIAGIPQQRSFWLRCFLGGARLGLVIALAASGLVWARVEPAGPIHLWRVHGFFMSAAGKPIGNVVVSLIRDGQALYKTKTDSAGEFEFDHVYGRYSLHIEKSKDYSQLSRDVVIGEAAEMLKRSTLYVLAGPDACTDDCSSVYTSRSEFEKAVRRNTERR